MRKRALVALALTALVVVAIVAVLVLSPFRGTAILLGDSCRQLPIDGKVQDIRLSDRGVAYVATGSTIVLIDLNVAAPRARAALAVAPPDFRPVAISLFQNRLYAVDRHEDGPSQIILFDQSPTGAFAPAGKPIRHTLLTAPVAVRATGPNQFYVANEPRFFFQEPTVLYYDGEKMAAVTAAAPERNRVVVRSQRSLVGAAEGTAGALMLCEM